MEVMIEKLIVLLQIFAIIGIIFNFLCIVIGAIAIYISYKNPFTHELEDDFPKRFLRRWFYLLIFAALVYILF